VAPPWVGSLLSLDRLFDEIREEHQQALPGKDEGEPAVDEESATTPAPQPAEPLRSQDEDDGMSAEAVDAALDALGLVVLGEGEAPSKPSGRARLRPSPEACVPARRDSPSPRMGQDQPGEPVALGMLLVTTTVLIVRANPGAKPGHRRPRKRAAG
jgi:hypothetical protein